MFKSYFIRRDGGGALEVTDFIFTYFWGHNVVGQVTHYTPMTYF